jgi:hypothetical protein
LALSEVVANSNRYEYPSCKLDNGLSLFSIICSSDKWFSIKVFPCHEGAWARMPNVPDSPFLLLLVVEGLSRMITASKRDGAITGIKLGSSLSLSRLLFVDDVMLFSLGTVSEAKKFKEILDLYCKAIGMEVNAHKSSILFNGLQENLDRHFF